MEYYKNISCAKILLEIIERYEFTKVKNIADSLFLTEKKYKKFKQIITNTNRMFDEVDRRINLCKNYSKQTTGMRIYSKTDPYGEED
jgi:hypothetical protein